MIKYSSSALCFDDILLVPQRSSVVSRHSINTKMVIGMGNRSINLDLPIIAAPMDTVCDAEMCIVMSKVGGLGILHRYMSYAEQITKAEALVRSDIVFGVAIASNNGFLDKAQKLYDVGVRTLLVDTANGHGDYAIRAVSLLREKFDDVHIMAGNVATAHGFALLAKAGADSVRVGIGGGSACTTRLVSGHGIPTLQSIIEIQELREAQDEYYACSIIADGGIRNSGDMVKAFAAGAEAVMVGSLLSGTDESPGEIYTDASGRSVKAFRGMASREAQHDATGGYSVAEGISTTVQYKGSVNNIIKDVRGGIGSGCSYSGVERLSDLSCVAQYIVVSNSTLLESKPHAL